MIFAEQLELQRLKDGIWARNNDIVGRRRSKSPAQTRLNKLPESNVLNGQAQDQASNPVLVDDTDIPDLLPPSPSPSLSVTPNPIEDYEGSANESAPDESKIQFTITDKQPVPLTTIVSPFLQKQDHNVYEADS